MVAALRFIFIELAYALFRLGHWWVIAVSICDFVSYLNVEIELLNHLKTFDRLYSKTF